MFSSPPSHRRRRTWAVAALALGVFGAAACSTDASTRVDAKGSGPTTTAAPVSVPETIPAGVTLRIGDQLDYLKTVLNLAGEDKDFGYTVEYSAFIGGPSMLQAFQGDAIDSGFVGSTPLIFAQAGGQKITAVAGWASENGAYGLITAPGHDDIKGWADLEGKKVAYQKGTAGEAALLQALDDVHLSLTDVTTVDLSQTQVSSALRGGSADAGISIEPLTSLLIQSDPNAKEVARAGEITDRSSFVIASDATLADTGKSAALADYIARLVRSFKFLKGHPELIAESVYAKQYGLPVERANELVKKAGTISFVELPGEIVTAQQRLADLFRAAGEIPGKVDVSSEFDTRFNDLVQKEQGS